MHVGVRIGAAAAAAGVVGFGAYQLEQHAAGRERTQHAELDRQVAEQAQAWDTWKTKYDAEFPGGRLDTPADHARLDAFLRSNPAPSWLKVDHADYTRARLSIHDDIVDESLLPEPEKAKGLGYAGVGAIGSIGMGVALLVGGLKGAGGLGALGLAAGGAALAAMGVGTGAMLVSEIRRGDNTEGYDALLQRIRADLQ